MLNRRAALARTLLLCRDFVGGEGNHDDQLVESFGATSVCIVADARNLAAPSAQSVLTTLVSQALMLGCRVRCVVPDVPLTSPQPPFDGPTTWPALRDLGCDVVPLSCGVEICTASSPADLTFVIGDTEWRGTAPAAWRLTGSAWRGRIEPVIAIGEPWRAVLPFGAIAASTLAAAEVFKAVLRTFSDQEALHAAHRAEVDLASSLPDLPDIDVGNVDFVSAGAITQATIYTLLRIPRLRMAGTVFDADLLEISNLNRYALMRRSMLGLAKVDVLAQYARAGVSFRPVRSRLMPENSHQLTAPTVVVGADSIEARWVAQRRAPVLIVGATSHFLTVTSEHRDGLACAGCLHPYSDSDTSDIPTVGFVSMWAGLLVAVRLVRIAIGRPSEETEQVLDLSALRLDSSHATWRRRVPRHPRCPLNCAA